MPDAQTAYLRGLEALNLRTNISITDAMFDDMAQGTAEARAFMAGGGWFLGSGSRNDASGGVLRGC